MFIKFSFLLLAWLAATHGSPYGCDSYGGSCDDSSNSWWPTQSSSSWPWGQSWNWGQQLPNWGQSWPTWGQGWPTLGQGWPSWDQGWSNWGQQWPSWGQQWPNWGQSWPNWGQSWQNLGQSWPNWGQSWSTDGSAPCCGGGQPNISPPGPPALPGPTPPPPVDFQMGGEPPIGRIPSGGISQGGLFPGGGTIPDIDLLGGGNELPIPVGTWSDFIKTASESGKAEYPTTPKSRKLPPAGFQSSATSTGKLNPAIMSFVTQSKAPRSLWWAIWYCLRTDNMFTAPCECLWAQLNECYMTDTPHPLCKCANRCKWWRWGWWGWDRPGAVAKYSATQDEN